MLRSGKRFRVNSALFGAHLLHFEEHGLGVREGVFEGLNHVGLDAVGVADFSFAQHIIAGFEDILDRVVHQDVARCLKQIMHSI